MLRIDAEARTSPIHGRGLFAREFIPKGAVVWAFDPGQDRAISVAEVENTDEETRRFILTYAYFCNHANGYILCGDDSRFVNHSEAPSIGSIDTTLECLALRDIFPGEELTEDYRTYDNDPLQQWSDLLFNPHAAIEAQKPALDVG